MRNRTRPGKESRKANPNGSPGTVGPQLVPSVTSSASSSAQTGVDPTGAGSSPKLENVSKLSPTEIDQLGRARAVIADYKLQVKPFEELEKRLENRVTGATAHLGPEEIFPGEGEQYRLMVGMQAEQQQLVDGGLAKVLGFIGQDKFLSICGVTFTALEKALTPEQFGQVVTKSRTGKRTITVVPKAAPAPLVPAA